MAPSNALASGNPDTDDESTAASKKAARGARFTTNLPGNRFKEVTSTPYPLLFPQPEVLM
jgi:hypothetical protein